MAKLLDRYGNPLSDSFCTPEWLTAILPQVDLDPCSNPRSTVRARRTFSLEKGLNGLELPWTGSVFVNWPYSKPLPWAKKFVNEWNLGRCTEAIVLAKLDTSTHWWKTMMHAHTPKLWLFGKRLQHDEPEGLIAARIARLAEKGVVSDGSSQNNFCSVIMHYMRPETERLTCLEPYASCWGGA